MSTRSKAIGYWIATTLVALTFIAAGFADLVRLADMVGAMHHLGYPVYLTTILGVWKLLGAVAIVAPRFPRLKEWAYAGMLFDLSGAAVSHAFTGDPVGVILTPLALLVLVGISWVLRPQGRVLGQLLA